MLTVPELLRGVLVTAYNSGLPPIIIGRFAMSVNNCLALSVAGAGNNTEYFGSLNPVSTLKPIIMLLGRSKSYSEVQGWVNTAYQILHRYRDENLLGVVAGGVPVYLGQDEEGYHEFQLILRVNVEG